MLRSGDVPVPPVVQAYWDGAIPLGSQGLSQNDWVIVGIRLPSTQEFTWKLAEASFRIVANVRGNGNNTPLPARISCNPLWQGSTTDLGEFVEHADAWQGGNQWTVQVSGQADVRSIPDLLNTASSNYKFIWHYAPRSVTADPRRQSWQIAGPDPDTRGIAWAFSARESVAGTAFFRVYPSVVWYGWPNSMRNVGSLRMPVLFSS